MADGGLALAIGKDIGPDFPKILGLHAKTVLGNGLGKGGGKFLLQFVQLNAVLRTFRTGHAGEHGAEVQFQFL